MCLNLVLKMPGTLLHFRERHKKHNVELPNVDLLLIMHYRGNGVTCIEGVINMYCPRGTNEMHTQFYPENQKQRNRFETLGVDGSRR
jgi:hypothetical protein